MHRTGGLFMFGEKSKKKKVVNLSDTVLHYSWLTDFTEVVTPGGVPLFGASPIKCHYLIFVVTLLFNILNTGRNELPRSNVSSMQNTKFKQSWLYYVGMENILFSLYNQPIRSRLMFCSPQSVSEVSQKGLLDFLGIVLKTININLVLSNAKLYLQTLEITEEQFWLTSQRMLSWPGGGGGVVQCFLAEHHWLCSGLLSFTSVYLLVSCPACEPEVNFCIP